MLFKIDYIMSNMQYEALYFCYVSLTIKVLDHKFSFSKRPFHFICESLKTYVSPSSWINGQRTILSITAT